jgi:hypothetical protein
MFVLVGGCPGPGQKALWLVEVVWCRARRRPQTITLTQHEVYQSHNNNEVNKNDHNNATINKQIYDDHDDHDHGHGPCVMMIMMLRMDK